MRFRFDSEGFELRPYSNTELAKMYQVDYRTMRNWIKQFEEKLGQKVGRYYTIRQVKIILQHLDIPGKILPEEFL